MILATILFLAARQATPTDTAQKFVAAWNARDVTTLANLTLGGKPENLAVLAQQKLPQVKITEIKETIDGANATVAMTISSTDQESEHSSKETDKLKLVDGKWLVVPVKPDPATAKEPGLLSMIAYLAATPGAMSGTVHAANRAAKSALCMSHAKQLGLGCFMYMNDSNDKFFKKGADIHKELSPYLKNDEQWTCPATGKPAFSVNARLLGTLSTKWAAPTKTVLVYEGKDYKLDFNHDGKAAVCFADGHAKLIDAAEAAKLRWKP